MNILQAIQLIVFNSYLKLLKPAAYYYSLNYI